MSMTFRVTATFKEKPSTLFSLYADPVLHAQATGMAAKFVPEAGAKFSAGAGSLSGKFLLIQKNKLIVQTWRAKEWDQSVPDTIVTISFVPTEDNGTLVELFHSNVRDDHAGILKKGWKTYYWDPWRSFLKKKAKS